MYAQVLGSVNSCYSARCTRPAHFISELKGLHLIRDLKGLKSSHYNTLTTVKGCMKCTHATSFTEHGSVSCMVENSEKKHGVIHGSMHYNYPRQLDVSIQYVTKMLKLIV